MSNAQKFDEYVTRFAACRGITKEEALELAIVKEYRDWISKQLDHGEPIKPAHT